MAFCETHQRHECDAHRSKGRGQCHGPAVDGTNPARCRMHAGGHAPMAKAAIRAELARWGDDMTTLDPGETLLRLMTVAYLRAEQHADELDTILETTSWRDTFVGDIASEFGKIGEYAKQLAIWESRERKHAADLAVKAVAAGLEERRVRAEERYAEAIAGAVEAALTAAGVDGTARDEGRHGAERYLRALPSG